MRSHLLHRRLYAASVAVCRATVFRYDARTRLRFGMTIWLVMVGGALALAYLMYPFPS